MAAIAGILTIPIMILNLLAAVVGGIWLAFAGDWSVLLIGLSAILIGHFAISLLLAPSMILVIPMNWALEKNHTTFAILLAIPSVLWTYLILAAWCFIWFRYFLHGVTDGTLVPRLLWAYAVATGPWTYLASVDARSDPRSPAITTSFFAQIGCVIMMVIAFATDGRPDDNSMYLGLGLPLLIALGIQVLTVSAAAINERQYRVR